MIDFVRLCANVQREDSTLDLTFLEIISMDELPIASDKLLNISIQQNQPEDLVLLTDKDLLGLAMGFQMIVSSDMLPDNILKSALPR